MIEFYKEVTCFGFFDCTQTKAVPGEPFNHTIYEAPHDQTINRVAGRCDSKEIKVKLTIKSDKFTFVRDISSNSSGFDLIGFDTFIPKGTLVTMEAVSSVKNFHAILLTDAVKSTA